MTTVIPTHMKAWLYSGTNGGLEKNMRLESTRAPPPPRANEILVQVLSAATNPADIKVPEMGPHARWVIGMPATPGMDFCGRVAATGARATRFSVGQLVHGSQSRPTKYGSLGEYLLIAADLVAAVPDGVAIDHAASLGIAGQTAYQVLNGYVKAHDRVLINGGSGGCGMFAIQIAKDMGCHVTVTCSTKNIEFCRGLGADEVVDYTAEQDLVATLCDRGIVFDHILDHIGLPSELYFQCHHFLRPGGIFVQVGASALSTFVGRVAWPSFLGGGKRKYWIFMFNNNGEHAARLSELVQKGAVKVQLDSVYEFADAVKAFEKQRSGRSRGKIVVHVADP
ncbi:Polyketide synthase enoylreductase [Penicillium capsulatum]|uniref:Polyketide synthase enoylreductase n=1 Tax=Penicillium capsulatum TaxID=69766 RepID=A0A9W9LRH5_9EURO|nr:Polyketide synthase enoylreductase [Penicillium capsulatum]KAJ6134955.1 Polyketide synthase enoylreductase [Penicillium capsulatum]